MKALVSRFMRAFVTGVSFAALHACVDTSPIDYHAPATPDAGPQDAAPINSDAARVVECKQCVVDDACSAEYDKCTADPKCGVFMRCLLDAYCVNIKPDLSQIPPCLVSCGLEAGINSSEDPAIPVFRGVLFCIEDHCGGPCGNPNN